MATLGGNICLDTRCWYYNQSKTWRQSRADCHKTGGNLCHAVNGSARCHAINSSDTAPVLIALDAQLVVATKDSSRTINCRDFYADDGVQHARLFPEEILQEIIVPVRDNAQMATFIKVSKRQGIDFAMGSIAALVTADNGKLSTVKLILGSMSSAPRLLEKASHIIMEEGLSDDSIEKAAEVARSELGVLTNLFTHAGYKRDLARVLVRRALHEQKKKLKKQVELQQ
jgi:4-hydroxybenzoyl-CoA reductase subunit beta